MKWLKNIRGSLAILFSMLFLLSVVYPLSTVYLSKELNSGKVPVVYNKTGVPVATPYMAFNFSEPYFFHSRPSINDYSMLYDNGTSAYGPVSQALYNYIENLTSEYVKNDNNTTIPINIVTFSSSGIDPDITLLSALIQIPRVSYFSNISQSLLLQFVHNYTIYSLTILGFKPYVDVVLLNMQIFNIMNETT